MLKRLIDNSGGYFSTSGMPTGESFFRIMGKIAISPSDKIYDVIPTSVEPETSSARYIGNVSNFYYEENKYKFNAPNCSNAIGSFYLFICMRVFTVTSEGSGVFSSTDSELYSLMKKAEELGIIDVNENIDATIWIGGPDDVPDFEFRCVWDSLNINRVEIPESEMAQVGAKVRKKEGKTKTTDWRYVKNTTGVVVDALNNTIKITPYTGIACTGESSKYAPETFHLSFYANDVKYFGITLHLNLMSIPYSNMEEFTTEDFQTWKSIVGGHTHASSTLTMEFGSNFPSPGYYDGVDFSDSPVDFITPEEIKLFRIAPSISFPLYFASETEWDIRDVKYKDFNDDIITKIGSFACCAKSEYHDGIEDKRYMGYYGRDMTGISGARINLASKSMSKSMFIPGVPGTKYMTDNDDIVSQDGMPMTFKFKDLYAFPSESDVENDESDVLFLINETKGASYIDSISIMSHSIESLDDVSPGDRKLMSDEDGNLYYNVPIGSLSTELFPRAATMELNTDNIPDAGILEVGGELIEYNSRTGNIIDIPDGQSVSRKNLSGSDVFFRATKLAYRENIGTLLSVIDIDGEAIVRVEESLFNDSFAGPGFIVINNEVFPVDWDSDFIIANEIVSISIAEADRGVKGTSPYQHSIGSTVYAYDFFKTGDVGRKDGINMDYSGDYKPQIVINRFNHDTVNRLAYAVEVLWKL